MSVLILLLLLIILIIIWKSKENFIINNKILYNILDKKILLINQGLSIIYYVYINKNRNWKYLIESQIRDIINSNILSIAKLHIVVTDEYKLTNTNYFTSKININSIEFHEDNKYEYYGIKKLYDLAIQNPNNIYCYIHSKGMVYHSNKELRNKTEEFLLKNILENYKICMHIFNDTPSINKIAYLPADNNSVWYNFFYVRGTYLLKCNPPKITSDRYYYEYYLGLESRNNHENDSYSLYSNTTIKYSHQFAMEHEIANFHNKTSTFVSFLDEDF